MSCGMRPKALPLESAAAQKAGEAFVFKKVLGKNNPILKKPLFTKGVKRGF